MSGLLRGLLVVLVLLNLTFVHLTGAADFGWLGPLVGLTIAAPALLPLRKHLAYRIVWNLAVVGVFALLVQHATSAGIQYMLEDGLLLAALCQVHLLNNIGRDQKPDLIFFNSFLIAVVTSFLSFDLGYSLVFLAYAPVLLFALQVHALNRSGREVTPRLLRRVFLDGALRAGAVLGVTLLVFLFLPRDFSRRGLLGDRLRWQPGQFVSAAYTEDVDLERTGRNAGGGDRVVLVARVRSGAAASVPATWRGGTLDAFDGRQWISVSGVARGRGDLWTRTSARTWERGGAAPGPVLEVELRDPTLPRIFVPAGARKLSIQAPRDAARIHVDPDQTFLNGGGRRRSPIRYEVELPDSLPVLGGGVGTSSRRVSPVFRRLEPGTAPVAAIDLAERVRAEGRPGEPQHAVVERMRARISRDYRWLPPGADGGARSLADFFDDAEGAHCEIFASALAVMLRSQGVPCRLAMGFRSSEWDLEEGTLTFRDRHAHAWVEVHDPAGGWYPVDPSPMAAEVAESGRGLFAQVRDVLRKAWGFVANFTDEGREQAIRWIAALPGRAVALGRDRPLPLAGILLLLAAWLVVRRRGREKAPPPVREYRRSVRRAKLALRPGETPRDLLRRARTLAIPADRLRRLELATSAHETARYRP